MIADYHDSQSLVQTLLANGISHVALTDWKPATEDMKDLEIDNYLAEAVVAIDDLGGRVNLVGGIKEKVVAAQRVGIRRIMLPARNRKDIEDIPEEVRRQLEFIWLERVNDAVSSALESGSTDKQAA